MTTPKSAYGARMEWAVRFADGEVEEVPTQEAAHAEVAHAREMVARGGSEAHAYDGARVVGRRLTVTDWFTLSERCPGHALTYCEQCEWTYSDAPQNADESAS